MWEWGKGTVGGVRVRGVGVCEPLEEAWLSAIPSPEAAGWERREGVILFPVSRPCVLSGETEGLFLRG